MIRSGFSSPLRFVLTRGLVAPSSSSSPSSSSLRRPFSLSTPSLADGLFPVHGKQGIKDIDYREINTVEAESIEAPKDKLAVESPQEGKVDLASPIEGITSTSSTTPTSSSETTTTSTTTPSTPSEDTPSSTTTADSSSSSIVDPSSSSPLPPFTNSFSTFQPPQLIPDALQQARRSIPPIVTIKEWRALVGPRSQVKVVRLSLTCSKNNTQGVLTWAYNPDEVATPELWNRHLPLGKFSGGSLGFKGSQSGGSEAGHQVVVNLFRRLGEENERHLQERKLERESKGEAEGYLPDRVGVQVRLNVSGFGQGREAFMKALKSEEGSAVRAMAISLSDHTPIRRSWPRPKKARRV